MNVTVDYIYDLLLSEGNIDNHSKLHLAVFWNDLIEIQSCIDDEKDINATNTMVEGMHNNSPPLMYVSSLDALQLLENNGATMTTVLPNGGTILHFAARSRLDSICQYIIDNYPSIDLDAEITHIHQSLNTVVTRTALELASEYGTLVTIQSLIDAGATITQKAIDLSSTQEIEDYLMA